MDKYILIINNSIKIKKYIKNICLSQKRYDLIDDLMQFCIIKIYLKGEDKLKELYDKGSLEDYFIGMLINQMKSSTSEFYKNYRNNGFWKSYCITDDIKNDISYNDDEQIDDVEKDLKLMKINKAILLCDPFKVDLFKMRYYENKSIKEISEFYNINTTSVKNKIFAVKNMIKDILNERIKFSEIRKKDHKFRRIRQGKIVITDEIILDIIDKYKNGSTKASLSRDYQLSYPYILRVIKENEKK